MSAYRADGRVFARHQEAQNVNSKAWRMDGFLETSPTRREESFRRVQQSHRGFLMCIVADVVYIVRAMFVLLLDMFTKSIYSCTIWLYL